MGANESRSNEPIERRSSNSDGSASVAERRFREKFPSGFMNKEQFISYYKLMTMSTLSDEECNNLFSIADSNEDGQVSFAEFELFCEILRSGSVEDRLRLTFKLYDKDKSKGITREEIVRMLKGLYKSKGWDDIDRRAARNADVIMAEIDGDSDGVLTEQEFIIGISSRENLVCLIFGNELSQ